MVTRSERDAEDMEFLALDEYLKGCDEFELERIYEKMKKSDEDIRELTERMLTNGDRIKELETDIRYLEKSFESHIIFFGQNIRNEQDE